MRISLLATALLLATLQPSTFTQEFSAPEENIELKQEEILPEEDFLATEDDFSIEEEPSTAQPTPAATPLEIPTTPEMVADVDPVIPAKEEPTNPVGIDTVSLEEPQGNWLYKRIWWERAEERYEKIRLLVDAIWESRTIFFIKRNELDRNVLDPFYLNIGVNQGELQIILSELNDFFEKQREQQGDLSEEERELYETLTTEQESLKQLKMDVESIANLDHAIDDALGTLMNQINRVRQFEKQAWDNFKEIAHMLSDSKARELYYMIEGAARNIKNISTYLERDFLNHFKKLIDEATKHVQRVQSQIQGLKEKGVIFKRQADIMAQQKEKERLAQEAANAEEDEEESTPKPKLGWFDWIMASIKNAFSSVVSIIRLPYDMIFGERS